MAFYDTRIREEVLKHRVAADWFAGYDCTRVIGNIDFAVDIPATELALGYAAEPALWAEAKAGAKKDIAESFVQLILMAGRVRGRVCPKRVEKDGSTSIDAIETIASTNPCNPCNPWLNFSPAAQAVLAAGRELWRYYHAQPAADPNASYYDIRAHFQGRKPNGTMNATSADAKYNELLDALKSAMKVLARQIEPKVYEYGFLRK